MYSHCEISWNLTSIMSGEYIIRPYQAMKNCLCVWSGRKLRHLNIAYFLIFMAILQTLFSSGSVSFFLKVAFKFLNFDQKKKKKENL